MTASPPPTFTLRRFPETLAVVRLGPGSEIPSWAESSSIFSVTATAAETSVVCAARDVPRKARHQRPFTAFEVQGPLDFSLVGVLATILGPLADAGIPVFVLSTFDTDWILVPGERADDTAQAWTTAGHTVEAAVPAAPAPRTSRPGESRAPRERSGKNRGGKK